MPFNFPVVENRSGELLAQGIAAAFANAAERRRQKRLEKQQDQARSDQRTMIEVQNPGLHLTERGVFDIPQSVWDNTAKSVSDAVDRGGTPSPAPARGMPASSDRSDFQQLLSQAMGDKTPAGPRYEFGNGFYRDNAETDAAAQRTTARSGNADFQKVLLHVLENQLTPKPQQHVVDPVTGKVNFFDPMNPPKDLSVTPAPKAPVPGTPEWRQAEIDKAKIGAEYGYHPPVSQFSFGTALGPDGKPVVLRQNTKTGEVTPTNVGKPATGGNGNTTSQMAAAKANMESAMRTMDEYEAKLRKDPSLFGALDATQGAIASSPSAITAQHAWDMPVSLLANLSASRMQQNNPELAKYLTAKKFIAEAILNTHKRPNQTQYEIEQEIGGVGANPSAMQIDMIADRRRRMYNEVFGGTETAAPAAAIGKTDNGREINLGAAKPKLTQEQYDAGRAKGHTDAEIAEHYDITGVRRKK